MNMISNASRLLTATVAWLVVIVMATAHADWPLFRGDSAGTGSSKQALSEQLDIVWQYSIKGLGFDAGPIIGDGKVFAADADGNVIALELSSGAEIWKVKYEAGFLSAPAYRSGAVYVGDSDGKLRALNANSGEMLWEYDAEREIDGGANFFKESVLITSQSGNLFSISPSDGKLKWKYETGDQLQCGPSLSGSTTFLGGCDQHLHVIDVETGKPIMDKIPIEGPTGSTPTVSGATVLVPNYNGQIWAFQSPKFSLLWKFEDTSLASEFKSSLAVADGLVIACSGNRRLFALELESGKLVWQQTIRRRADSSPIIAADQVILAGSDGRVLRFQLKTGKELPAIELKGGFLGSPATSAGRLVLASDRGDIYCLGDKTTAK
jgi:outer membrane protein assembly factor BamB